MSEDTCLLTRRTTSSKLQNYKKKAEPTKVRGGKTLFCMEYPWVFTSFMRVDSNQRNSKFVLLCNYC